MTELAGRTAFVTGGAHGIGFALARALLAADCKVAIADVRGDDARAAAASLNDPRVLGVELDVAMRAAYGEALDRTEATLGPVSLLFNNAGVTLYSTADETTEEEWDWVLGVNLRGVIHGIQHVLPRLKARGGGGHIVMTGSMGGFLCGAFAGAYTVSKFAVRGLAETLYYSLAPHEIGVSLLSPGLVASNLHAVHELRPASLPPIATPFGGRLADIHRQGMSPDEVADATLAAVRDNRFHVFTHPELKQDLREVFDEILADYPDGQAPPERVAIEERRRAQFATERTVARARRR